MSILSEDKDHVGAFSHAYRVSKEDYSSPRDAPSKILSAYACRMPICQANSSPTIPSPYFRS